MKVPTYDSLQVGANTLPAQGVSTQNTAPIGGVAAQQAGAIGHGLQALGETGLRIATDMQQEVNQTIAKDVSVQAMTAFNGLLHDPQNGYLTRQGKNALEGQSAALDEVQRISTGIVDKVKNTEARKLAEFAVSQRAAHALDAINKHAGREAQRYQVETNDAWAKNSIADAAGVFDDDERFNRTLGIVKNAADTLGKLQGWSEERRTLQENTYRDTAFIVRYEQWGQKDPVRAFSHLVAHAGEIGPDAFGKIARGLFQTAAPLLAAQVNAVGGATQTSPAEGDAIPPRGIRNNNPGNIMRGGKAWDGEIQGNDAKYATFETPEAGLRAMGKTLLAYQDKHGLSTVGDIIARYAPATENDTNAYTGTVAKAMGVKPDERIDLHSGDTLARLMRSMIQVENGSAGAQITDAQIAAGVAAANGKALPASPARLTTSSLVRGLPNRTGIDLVDQLPDQWKLRVLQMAQTQARQDMAEARENLRGKVADASAEYLATGTASNPPGEIDFIRAYGQADGLAKFRDFQNTAHLGQTLQQVKTIPTASLVELLKTEKPAPGDGFATRQHNYNILTNAIGMVVETRQKDPIAYALKNDAYSIRPIVKVEDIAGLSQELPRRASAARAIANDYAAPLRLFSNDEAARISAQLKASPVEGQKQYLGAMAKSINNLELFKQTMQAIAPDAPTVAIAGIYQAQGLQTTDRRDVADLILRGQAILTPNKKQDGGEHQGGQALLKMPEEKLLLSEWINATGDAFKGKEHAADLFQQTAKAIYAARSAEDGDYSGLLNAKRWKAAIMLATGGIESYNGNKIVMPYGMPFDKFQNALKVQAEKLAPAALNTSAREMLRLPLENIGDGRYLFRRGAGYLVDKDGRPVIADLSGGY